MPNTSYVGPAVCCDSLHLWRVGWFRHTRIADALAYDQLVFILEHLVAIIIVAVPHHQINLVQIQDLATRLLG